ncbi:MAG: 2,3-bisphosphoglycerate-independent phosphoglycerate mutase [Chloroflexota bacterium]
MIPLEVLGSLATKTDTKIILLVVDGLGGMPHIESGLTELETANVPNMDALAAQSVCGLIDPVGPGISPGSGAGHLALFGYDPIRFNIGRGALSAFGLDFELGPNDLAARANFCTMDEQEIVTDRRAGRITTETNRELSELLRQISIPGNETFIVTESGHRVLVVFRGDGLEAEVSGTDPLLVGQPLKEAQPLSPTAQTTADLINRFSNEARRVLAGRHPANAILMRGFAKRPDIPTFQTLYKLTPAAVAAYPMYRGVARLAGMEALPTGNSVAAEFQVVADNWAKYDFFFIHVKYADSAGEDGDFARKVQVLEEVDRSLPTLLQLKPQALVITGDHSTPATLKNHSWHPVPFLLHSPWCIPDKLPSFDERSVRGGALGRFPAVDGMSLMMGYAQKLARYGA